MLQSYAFQISLPLNGLALRRDYAIYQDVEPHRLETGFGFVMERLCQRLFFSLMLSS
jgi:hypothetical protein